MLKIRALTCVFVMTALTSLGAQAAPKKKIVHESTTETADLGATDSPLGGRLEIQPDFGYSFISPGDVNGIIRDENERYQKDAKNFNLGDISSTLSYGGSVTYRVVPALALGLGVHHLDGSSDSSVKIPQGTLNGLISLGMTSLVAQSHISMARSADRKFELLASPFVGVGFYNLNSKFGGTALTAPTEMNTSGTGPVFGATLGARYWFLNNLALGVDAGYTFAKSGNLKIGSVKNVNDPVGSTLEIDGKKINVDASAFAITSHLTWSI
jgi:hypothetical protein